MQFQSQVAFVLSTSKRTVSFPSALFLFYFVDFNSFLILSISTRSAF